MEALKSLIEENGLGEHLNGFVGELGVESPADLQCLAEEVLRSLGIKPVPARRFLRLLVGPDSTIPFLLPRPCCSESLAPHSGCPDSSSLPPRASHNDGDAVDEQSPLSTGSSDPAGQDDGGDAAVAEGDADPAVACGDGDDGMGG